MKHTFQIIHVAADYLPPRRSGETPWQEYFSVRNAIVTVCRRHGPTGPMGLAVIEPGGDQPEGWERGDDDPVYFVVDDQYNDDPWLYLEVLHSSGLTENWFMDVSSEMSQFPGWSLFISHFVKGSLVIESDRICVGGVAFEICSDLPGILDAARCHML